MQEPCFWPNLPFWEIFDIFGQNRCSGGFQRKWFKLLSGPFWCFDMFSCGPIGWKWSEPRFFREKNWIFCKRSVIFWIAVSKTPFRCFWANGSVSKKLQMSQVNLFDPIIWPIKCRIIDWSKSPNLRKNYDPFARTFRKFPPKFSPYRGSKTAISIDFC